MSTMKVLTLVLTLGGTLLFTATYWTEAQEPRALNAVPAKDASILMQAKLASSQRIVEGLMAGDFSRIHTGASQLAEICEAKNWRRLEDQVVVHYRAELLRSSLKLKELARAENLDGAAYAYMGTLTTCINCHQYSRDVLRIAQHSPPQMVVPIPVTEPSDEVYLRAFDR